jgi:Skp family chaperone for outer membrane proteins
MDEGRRFRWYEVLYLAVLVGILVYSIFFLNPHRAGVMEIGAVARGVGMDARITEENRRVQEALTQKVRKLQADANPVVEALSKQIETASGAKKEELRTSLADNQKRFQDDVGKARSDAQRHMLRVTATFRRRIQPVIDRVARKRGLDLVIEPGGSYVRPPKRVNITDEVIAGSKPLFKSNPPLIDESLLATPVASGERASAEGLPAEQ